MIFFSFISKIESDKHNRLSQLRRWCCSAVTVGSRPVISVYISYIHRYMVLVHTYITSAVIKIFIPCTYFAFFCRNSCFCKVLALIRVFQGGGARAGAGDGGGVVHYEISTNYNDFFKYNVFRIRNVC